MRPLMIQVPHGSGSRVLEKAQEVKGKNLSLQEASGVEGKLDLIFASISNRKVEKFISEVSEIDDVHITLLPQGVMAMYPPDDEAPDQVTDVEMRSPIEIFLSGLQSIGSWKGFIGYSIITSIVVWIGLFTNTSYLLVAAMLIAPFAGPAMNTAIATARGDWPLLRQGLMRYFVSISITIAGTFILSLLLQQDIATPLMVDRSQVSSIAVLLALSAGAAGALNLVQSERDSLVSGAAVGMLVAASLAPPAGVVGMAAAIGKWEMMVSGIFLLFLQLIGINLTGSLVFRMYGLNLQGPRYKRGRKSVFSISLFLTVAALGTILYLQLHQSPDLQRSSRAQRANAEIQRIIEEYPGVQLVESNVRFTRANIETQNSLLCVLYLQPDHTPNNQASSVNQKPEIISKIRMDLTQSIHQGLQPFNVTPLVNMVFIEPPTVP